MNKDLKILYISASSIPMIVGLASPAAAQQAETANDAPAGLQEIVVTAQRRAENLQDIPIAVTALTAEGLAKGNINTLADLSGRVPGLVIGGALSGGGSNALSIRGVTGQAIPIGADSAVSVYLDGVYLSKAENALFSLGDVERLEVLRGPQGTLYGRNATAGAINIITRTPGTRWSGLLDLNYGSHEAYETKAYIGGPLGGGFSASLSGAASGSAGFYRNVVTGLRIDPNDTYTVRGKLRFESADGAFDATLSADQTEQRGDFTLFHFGDGPTAAFVYNGTANYPFTPDDLGGLSFNTRRTRGVSLTMNLEATERLTLTSITSARDHDVDAFYSLSPVDGYSLNGQFLHTLSQAHFGPGFSQEIRGVYQGERINLTTGITYFREKARSQFGQVIGPRAAPYPTGGFAGAPNAPLVRTLTESYAAFGQLEWSLTDQFTLIAGLRANHEFRRMTNSFPFQPALAVRERQTSDDVLIPKMGVNFKPSDNILLYATVSRGYQAPGFSPATSPANNILAFQPEKLVSYEAGAKTELFDRRIRLNLTGYHYDYTNLQVRVTTGFIITTVNANAKVDGAELEAQALVIDGLTLFANANLQQARYTQFCDAQQPFDQPLDCTLPGTTGQTGVDRRGDALNQAPKFQGNIGFDYSRDLSESLQLSLNATASHQSETFFAPGELRFTRGGSFTNINARAALQWGESLEVYVFGKNITNVHRPTGILFTGGVLGNVVNVGQVNTPRIYGAGLRYSF